MVKETSGGDCRGLIPPFPSSPSSPPPSSHSPDWSNSPSSSSSLALPYPPHASDNLKPSLASHRSLAQAPLRSTRPHAPQHPTVLARWPTLVCNVRLTTRQDIAIPRRRTTPDEGSRGSSWSPHHSHRSFGDLHVHQRYDSKGDLRLITVDGDLSDVSDNVVGLFHGR